MNLWLTRTHFGPNSTLGKLVEQGFRCHTLEDAVREVPGVPVAEWKIKGQTAIPEGSYNVVITMSARFKRRMPLLLDVPGFSGIRIHAGNTDADTQGCILVGSDYMVQRNGNYIITGARLAYDALFTLIDNALEAGESVRLTVTSVAKE